MIKVLIVEDDPMVAQFHRHYLAQLDGFKLGAVAKNSDEALELLENQSYDLVLLDIFIPGMNGLELLSKIRSMGHNVDVIVISAARDSQRINAALRHGAVDYLIKPFEFDRFSAALNNYKNRAKIMLEQENLSQEDLDKGILHKDYIGEAELPKGLDRNTLKLVWEKIVEVEGDFTTEEMASLVGISRVSIRKYLEFLKTLKVLKLEIQHGSVGRPVYKYRCINHDISAVNNYF